MPSSKEVKSWIDRKTVKELKQWWKLWSIQLAALATVISQLDDLLPGWEQVVSPEVHTWTVRAIFFAAVISRFIKQQKLHVEEYENADR